MNIYTQLDALLESLGERVRAAQQRGESHRDTLDGEYQLGVADGLQQAIDDLAALVVEAGRERETETVEA